MERRAPPGACRTQSEELLSSQLALALRRHDFVPGSRNWRSVSACAVTACYGAGMINSLSPPPHLPSHLPSAPAPVIPTSPQPVRTVQRCQNARTISWIPFAVKPPHSNVHVVPQAGATGWKLEAENEAYVPE
eukprot:1588453-Rhodomonas_salina.1